MPNSTTPILSVVKDPGHSMAWILSLDLKLVTVANYWWKFIVQSRAVLISLALVLIRLMEKSEKCFSIYLNHLFGTIMA